MNLLLELLSPALSSRLQLPYTGKTLVFLFGILFSCSSGDPGGTAHYALQFATFVMSKSKPHYKAEIYRIEKVDYQNKLFKY